MQKNPDLSAKHYNILFNIFKTFLEHFEKGYFSHDNNIVNLFITLSLFTNHLNFYLKSNNIEIINLSEFLLL